MSRLIQRLTLTEDFLDDPTCTIILLHLELQQLKIPIEQLSDSQSPDLIVSLCNMRPQDELGEVTYEKAVGWAAVVKLATDYLSTNDPTSHDNMYQDIAALVLRYPQYAALAPPLVNQEHDQRSSRADDGYSAHHTHHEHDTGKTQGVSNRKPLERDDDDERPQEYDEEELEANENDADYEQEQPAVATSDPVLQHYFDNLDFGDGSM